MQVGAWARDLPPWLSGGGRESAGALSGGGCWPLPGSALKGSLRQPGASPARKANSGLQRRGSSLDFYFRFRSGVRGCGEEDSRLWRARVTPGSTAPSALGARLPSPWLCSLPIKRAVTSSGDSYFYVIYMLSVLMLSISLPAVFTSPFLGWGPSPCAVPVGGWAILPSLPQDGHLSP